jgi:hypothetical protein
MSFNFFVFCSLRGLYFPFLVSKSCQSEEAISIFIVKILNLWSIDPTLPVLPLSTLCCSPSLLLLFTRHDRNIKCRLPVNLIIFPSLFPYLKIQSYKHVLQPTHKTPFEHPLTGVSTTLTTNTSPNPKVNNHAVDQRTLRAHPRGHGILYRPS